MIQSILPVVTCLAISIPDLQAEESPGFVTETSEHYSLTFEGSREDAKGHLAVLEAAWPYQKQFFFGAEPKLEANEKLKVFFADNEASYQKQLKADGIGKTGQDAGGYYCPNTKKAYLRRTGTIFYTRQLLIHECLHQFHFLACTNNQSPKAIWFIEGLAEYFPRHFWDGKNFTPCVVPTLSLEDYYAEALKQVSDPSFDLKKLIEGEVDGERPQWMAIIGWLFECKKENFYKIFNRLNTGEEPKDFTVTYFGEPKEATKQIIEWLRKNQEEWTSTDQQWDAYTENCFRGHAYPQRYITCRTKAHADEVSAFMEFPAEGQWQGGFLLEFVDADDYMMLQIDSEGLVSLQRLKKGIIELIHSEKIKLPERRILISAKRKGKNIDISIPRAKIPKLKVQPGPLGFVIHGCSMTFSDIKWKPTQMK